MYARNVLAAVLVVGTIYAATPSLEEEITRKMDLLRDRGSTLEHCDDTAARVVLVDHAWHEDRGYMERGARF